MSDLSKKKIPRSTAFYQRKIKKEKITQAFNLLWPSFHDRQDHNTTPTTSNLSEHKSSNNPDDLTDTEFNRMFEIENFSVKNCFPDNDNGSEELVNLDESKQEEFERTQTEKTELINMSLLSLFYSGKLSQTGLKQVVQLFKIATNFDIPTLVSFSKEFPNFLIPSDQETKIRDLISETGHLNGQKAFREIVSILINKTDFLSKSASQIIKEYPHIINPLEELLRRNDKSFSICKRSVALNSLVHDTRKSQKKVLSKVENNGKQLNDSDIRDNSM